MNISYVVLTQVLYKWVEVGIYDNLDEAKKLIHNWSDHHKSWRILKRTTETIERS